MILKIKGDDELSGIKHTLSQNSEIFMFKDEVAPKKIASICALKSKLYSLLILDPENESGSFKSIGKGVCYSNLEILDYGIYLLSLIRGMKFSTQYFSLRSYNQKIYRIESLKKSLDFYDDKRFYLSCTIHSRPYGHFKNKEGDICDICS